MKRPSFQFYPADWQGNPNLKRCTREEKSIWLDLLFILHDQDDEYGLVRWPLSELANAVGEPVRKLRSLVSKGVLKGADNNELCAAYVYTPRSGRKDGDPVTLIPEQGGPIWYSSRMVRDEYVRKIRGENSRFTNGQPDEVDTVNNRSPDTSPKQSPKASPKGYKGDGSTTSSSTSSSDTSLRSVSGAPVLELTAGGPSKPTFPDWWPKEAWGSYLEMRRKKKAPVTDRVVRRLVDDISKLRAQGQDPAAVLDQSALHGWVDIYALKEQRNGAPAASITAPPLSADDRWRRKLKLYAEKRVWVGPDGAEPLDRDGSPHPDCCVPRHLLAEFGFLAKPKAPGVAA